MAVAPAVSPGLIQLGASMYPWDARALTADGGTIISERRFGGSEVVLVHALGHALGCWHTHHGLEVQPQCAACWERADRLNADTTGDRCSDTPPGKLGSDGRPLGGQDPCSTQPWPTTGLNNFMSVYPYAGGRFTPQQAGRRHAWINHALSGWLDNNTPAAPSGLTAVPTPFDEIQLTWTDNAWNETACQVERRTAGGAFVVVATLGPGVIEWLATTPPAQTLCQYRVKALNGAYSSYLSATVAATSSPAPGIEYVDQLGTGTPDGSSAHPWRTVLRGYQEAHNRSIIKIQSGTYPEAFVLTNKLLRLEALGGTVLIQKP